MVDEVARNGVEYILARDGRPEAALISCAELARLREIEQQEQQFAERREHARERIAALSADRDEQELDADIEAARRETWEARHGRPA